MQSDYAGSGASPVNRFRRSFWVVALCASTAYLGSCGSSAIHPVADGGTLEVAPVLEGDASPDLEGDASPDSGGKVSEELCAQMCRTTLEIACPDQPTMVACVADCLGQTTNCPLQVVEAYYQCIVSNGSQALLCNLDARAIFLRTGYCTKEESDVNSCL
jgi:hypothetical protein